ncbi:hypothetical protein [Bdellovibrio reynosensis]|uniref:Peptidase MA-like domain-containing protein n=1 Tax=Bdellovibrio reynosensis TaxID=2835041 RepID=A0ABY4CEI0_9BACT|nr:hypothetical protein [Bdellovibrio reynosensis]UOF02297.1 hypothetical protein MNR06_04950 [Bdellovibrio reynosensis]
MGFRSSSFIYTALVCLFAVQVHAQMGAIPMENHCPEISAFAGVELWQDAATLAQSSCQFASLYTPVISEIHKWAPIDKKVFLSLKDSASGASYDGIGILSSAEKLYFESADKEKHLRSHQANLVTFAHEYGHVIFSEWLAREIPAYKQLQLEIRDSTIASQMIYSLANKRALLNKFLTQAPANQREALSAELKDVERNLGQVYFQASEYTQEQTRILNIIAPYHELFADVVAVLYAQDPQAMRHSIEFAGAQGKDLYAAEARDFSHNHSADGWQDTTAHYMLSPTRSYLFADHWVKNYSGNEKAAYIKLVFKVLKEEIQTSWNSDAIDAASANKSLIKRFQSHKQ